MRIEPKSQEHRYAARLEWTGQAGAGPMAYATYGRSFRVRVQGKPELIGSADPVFCGLSLPGQFIHPAGTLGAD